MFRLGRLSSRILNNTLNQIEQNAKRSLYGPTALGMDNFASACERIKMQISNVDKFKAKMEEFVADENSKNLIFTEDLKNIVHIAESKDDLKLITQMIEKFCKQSDSVRFGNFVFGPPVMRLLYQLNDAETALALFKKESLDAFFDQLISYQILADLLFKSERYQDVLDIYEVIKSRQVMGGRYPKHLVVLTFGACYKLNTPESFEFASNLFKETSEAGHVPMRRAVTFMAALALNQNQPSVALETVMNVRQQNYLTIRAIKALGYLGLKRYDDVLTLMKSVLEVDNPMANKQTFPKDTIEAFKKGFEECQNKEMQTDFKKVIGFIEKHGHVSNETLDEILCSEIVGTAYMPNQQGGFSQQGDFPQQQQRFNNRNRGPNDFQQNDRRYPRRDFGGQERTRRPGLHELY